MQCVLCFEFGGFGEKYIVDSFNRLGYRTITYMCNTKNYDYDKELFQQVIEYVKNPDVDIVFSINFLPIISKVCQIYKKIYISWVYDSPELHLYSSAIKNTVNRIFLFDKKQYLRFYRQNPNNIFHLPLGTQPLTDVGIETITDDERKQYSHDICFIGSMYDDRKKGELDRLPEYWKGYIQGIIQAQLNVFGYNFIGDALSDEAIEYLKNTLKYQLIDDYERNDREIISDMFVGALCSGLDRERTICHIAKTHDVVLYTGSDTSKLKANCKILSKGFADPITMMPKIFHCSRINLNITSKTIQSGIPLRVFDVLGSRGFLITNYQEELLDWFEPGHDLVIYEDLEDLSNKIDYYLVHDDERNQIAENGYKKVCENFTYDKMLSIILEYI